MEVMFFVPYLFFDYPTIISAYAAFILSLFIYIMIFTVAFFICKPAITGRAPIMLTDPQR